MLQKGAAAELDLIKARMRLSFGQSIEYVDVGGSLVLVRDAVLVIKVVGG